MSQEGEEEEEEGNKVQGKNCFQLIFLNKKNRVKIA